MIEYRDVRKVFKQGRREVVALGGVSGRIEKGEFVSVMGPSGSGKSTLLHLTGGLDLPTGGEVAIEGRATSRMGDDELTLLRRRRIGFIFQFFNLMPTLTVVENVALPLLLEGARLGSVRPKVDALLGRVGLADRATHMPEELSGGEMQRVAIARALVTAPAILLADEPTGNLDTTTGESILQLIKGVASEGGVTVVMVTHDPKAASFGHRLLKLRDGKVDGQPS